MHSPLPCTCMMKTQANTSKVKIEIKSMLSSSSWISIISLSLPRSLSHLPPSLSLSLTWVSWQNVHPPEECYTRWKYSIAHHWNLDSAHWSTGLCSSQSSWKHRFRQYLRPSTCRYRHKFVTQRYCCYLIQITHWSKLHRQGQEEIASWWWFIKWLLYFNEE